LKRFIGKYASSDGRYLSKNGELLAFAPYGLSEYILPDTITSIGNEAFNGCGELQSITIPNSVTSIGEGILYNCHSLTSVYCKPATPPTGDNDMFSYYDSGQNKPLGCKIYVPRNSVDAYKSAEYWSAYASYIVGYDF
jgi:hypothetical protein